MKASEVEARTCFLRLAYKKRPVAMLSVAEQRRRRLVRLIQTVINSSSIFTAEIGFARTAATRIGVVCTGTMCLSWRPSYATKGILLVSLSPA
jgi:hypothetical protein